jgi:hypothetical protein
MSDEEGQEGALAQGTTRLGIPPWAKNVPILAKSPPQAALQATHSQGEDTAGFTFYPVLERPDPNDPGMQQRFHEKIPFKTSKEVTQACTMYGCTAPLMLGLLQSVVGDSAMSADDWAGLAVHASLLVITCCGKEVL